MKFEEYGKKLDDLAKEIGEHAKPLVDKVKELHGGMKEALKTADRRGFERAIRLAAGAARPGDESIAVFIEKIPYTSVD